MSPAKAKKTSGAQSIERALSVLRAVAAAPVNGATLSQVVAFSDLSKGTAHRLLSVLAAQGLIERDEESKSYFLGREIYALGTLAAPRYGIHELALPALHRLAALSQDSAFLCLLTGNEVMCVHREEGTYPIRTHVIQAGSRYPLGVGSFGPAILAAMDESTAEEFIVATSKEIAARYKEFSADKLRQFVKTARRTGFSVNPGLVYPGSWGIAVAVIDARGQPIGALSIGAVESRLQPERQPKLAAALKAESLALTKQLTKQRSR